MNTNLSLRKCHMKMNHKFNYQNNSFCHKKKKKLYILQI